MSGEYDLATQMAQVRRELQDIGRLVQKVVFAIADAESEIPEKMRRFANYMHDIHDVKYMYEEHGSVVPPHVISEIERLDDRYRQLLKELNLEGNAFAKIRRDMAGDAENRWNHTRLLEASQEKSDEARTSEQGRPSGVESGAPRDEDQPSRGEPNGRGPG